MTVYVLDTSSLLVLHVPRGSITCNHVLMEVRNKRIKDIVTGLVEGGVLRVAEPSVGYIRMASEVCRELGEFSELSTADVHVIALAVMLRDSGEEVAVLTDDFSIQNILRYLGIDYSVIRRGIKKGIKWVVRCSSCGMRFNEMPSEGVCSRCGGRVVRAPSLT